MHVSHAPAPAALAAAVFLTLAAPPAPAQDGKFADLTYVHLPRLAMDCARVEVAQEYKSSGEKPNVEDQFPVPPARAVARWAQDRLDPVGRFRLCRVVVKDASVVEVPLPKTGGIKGWFTTDQSERYDASVEVSVEIRSDTGRNAFATARVKRSQTVEDGTSLNKRREVWYAMTEKLMADLDKELERSMRQYLGAYIK
jgi:hypothetical protein